MLQQDGMDFGVVLILSSALNFGTEFVDGDGFGRHDRIGYLPTRNDRRVVSCSLHRTNRRISRRSYNASRTSAWA